MGLPQATNPSVPAPLRLSNAPDALSLFLVENIAVIAWHEPATVVVASGLNKLFEPVRTSYPAGVSVVHVGDLSIGRLDAETRAVLARSLRAQKDSVFASAIVTPASGFWSSTLRSIASGILMIARSSHEMRFHHRVEDVMSWLPEVHRRACGVDVDRAALLQVLKHAESLFGRPAPALHG